VKRASTASAHLYLPLAEAGLEAPLGFLEQGTEGAVATRDAGEVERCSSFRLDVAGAAEHTSSGWVVIWASDLCWLVSYGASYLFSFSEERAQSA
jgi:hypothetical protein